MLNERGHEILDSEPLARPLHINVAESLADKIKRMVRYELSAQADATGQETFEEADDFDVGDDPELASPYELSDSNFEERYGTRVENPGNGAASAGNADGGANANNGQPESNGGKPGTTGATNQPSSGNGEVKP